MVTICSPPDSSRSDGAADSTMLAVSSSAFMPVTSSLMPW